MSPMLCTTCIGTHLDPAADIPTVCPTCNGSGLTTRINSPVGVLVRAAEKAWDMAAHDRDNILRPGEDCELYARAGRLYAAAAALRGRGTPGRAQLAAISYRAFDAANQRATGRKVLEALGYSEGQRIVRGWMDLPTVGGVQ